MKAIFHPEQVTYLIKFYKIVNYDKSVAYSVCIFTNFASWLQIGSALYARTHARTLLFVCIAFKFSFKLKSAARFTGHLIVIMHGG